MKSKIFALGMFLIYFLAFGAAPGYAVDKIVIKATTVQMPSQFIGEALMKLKAEVEAKLKDRIEFKAYPSAQLYKQTEEIQALSRGEIQMAAVIGTGSLPKISSVFQVIELPGLFPGDIDIFFKVLNGPAGQELWAQAEKKNIRSIAFWHTGVTSISNRKNILVKLPKDVKGLKIRAAGKTYAELVKNWGGMSVSIPSEEQYSALQQGVMDGIMTAMRIISERKLYEHLTDLTSLGYLINRSTNFLVNDKWWKGLPEDVRGIIASSAQKVASIKRGDVAGEDKEAFKIIEGGGTKVHRLSDEEFKVWRQSARKIWPAMAGKIGQQWIDKFEKAVEQAEKTS